MKTKILFLTMFCIYNYFITPEDLSLVFEYQNSAMIISSKNKSFNIKIENTYEGMYQISRDKTKMIIFTESENEEPYYNSIYFIDSKKGKKIFVMKNWQNAMSDFDINYLLLQNDINNPYNFYLFDITKQQYFPLNLKVNNPNVIEKVFLSVQIYRSLDKRFDFIIDLSADAYTAAEYGFCIKNKKFTKIFDQTLGNESSYKILDERTDFEVGW